MGCIWSARHETLDTQLAVKFIHPIHTSSIELRGRFAREAITSARISSPHVVQVYDYGIEDDTPYLVMELLEGEDLGARLKRQKRLSLEATCSILVQIAKGLRRAHEAGIIHRDLKPANIFIARDMDEEIVKILDFGIAKLTSGPEVTGLGQLVGSPLYMSPEQIYQSKSIDQRSDLWSLAVILFRAITGKAPFPGDDSATVLLNVLGNSNPVPSQVDPSLPPELDPFFERAFKRDPKDRFQSAREMADAFVEAALGEPPSASSWSVIGLCLNSTRSSSTPLPALIAEPAPLADATTLTAPMPSPASAQLKTLPSADSLVPRPIASDRPRADRTTRIDIVGPPPPRRISAYMPWHVVAVSTILGFAIGWQVLPGPSAAPEFLEHGAAAAARTGVSMLRGLVEARTHEGASPMRDAETTKANVAPLGAVRPLDGSHSALAKESVPASARIPASDAAPRPQVRRAR
jgi:serine/threonine-protein kinase